MFMQDQPSSFLSFVIQSPVGVGFPGSDQDGGLWQKVEHTLNRQRPAWSDDEPATSGIAW